MPSHFLNIVSATVVVISSTGVSAEILGEVLGQYEYDEDTGCFVQTSTEQKNEASIRRYLCSKYYQNIKMWLVTNTPNEDIETIHAWIMSKELQTGWIYHDGDDTWKPDPSLTVTSGSLPPLPTQFTVTGEIGPSYIGVYNKTERWWSGRPVYVNDQGQLLYHDRCWLIGDELGYHVLSGSRSYHSPACERSWTYGYGSDRKIISYEEPASVKIVSGEGGELVLGILIKIAKILQHKSLA